MDGQIVEYGWKLGTTDILTAMNINEAIIVIGVPMHNKLSHSDTYALRLLTYVKQYYRSLALKKNIVYQC